MLRRSFIRRAPLAARPAATAALFGAALAGAVFALGVGAAAAQNAGSMQRIPKAGGIAAPSDTLTRDELRACVALEKRAGTESDAALHAQTLLVAEKARLEALHAELARLKGKLKFEREGEVDTFNRLAQQQRDWVAEFNAKIPDANGLSDRANASRERFKNECAKRSYLERDMDAIEREGK